MSRVMKQRMDQSWVDLQPARHPRSFFTNVQRSHVWPDMNDVILPYEERSVVQFKHSQGYSNAWIKSMIRLDNIRRNVLNWIYGTKMYLCKARLFSRVSAAESQTTQDSWFTKVTNSASLFTAYIHTNGPRHLSNIVCHVNCSSRRG